MGVEQTAFVAVLAAVISARILLADQLLPDVRHLHRGIARLRDQPGADGVGFGLHFAAVAEQREQGAELGQLDIIAQIHSCTRAADAGEHRPDGEQVRLAPLVAPRADHMAAQEMPGFVRDHAAGRRATLTGRADSAEENRLGGHFQIGGW